MKNSGSRELYTIQSILSYRLRKLFARLYFFYRTSPAVIGTPFYEAKLLEEIVSVMAHSARYFHHGATLPDAYGVGLSERCVEIPWVFAHLGKTGGIHLDAGSSLNFESLLKTEYLSKRTVIIANLNAERNCYWHKEISYVFWDLRKPLFREDIFDTISCISVLEHIGLDNSAWTHKRENRQQYNAHDYRGVVREFRRILKPGGNCYITVPYGMYKNHGWLQVFNRRMVNTVIESFKPATSSVTYFTHCANGWKYSDEYTASRSHYSTSYLPDCTVGAGSVACIQLTKST